MDDNESRIVDEGYRIRVGVISKVLKLLLPKNNKIFGESVPRHFKTFADTW
jgi:hypothetical protein